MCARIFRVSLLCASLPALAQAQNSRFVVDAPAPKTALSVGVSTGPTLSQPSWGLGMGLRFYATRRLSAGLQFLSVFQHSENTVQRRAASPVIRYENLAFLVQYDVVQSPRFLAGLTLGNGVAAAQQAKEFYGAGRARARRSRGGAASYAYLFQPGFDVSYRLSSATNGPALYVNAQGMYRILAGGAQARTRTDLSGPAAMVGISVLGLDRLRLPKKAVNSRRN